MSQDQIRNYFGPQLAFDALIRALNKGVEASEVQVRAELAKEQAKAGGTTEYTIRQVIIATPAGATPASLAERGKAAEQLRARFTSCDGGAATVAATPEAVIKEPIVRTSTQLTAGLKQILDKTAVGHLTPPQRSNVGIEMVALCNKGMSHDDTALRTEISDRLLSAHLADAASRRLKEMRSRAVITKPQG